MPITFQSQGVLHEKWEEVDHLFARHWVQTCRGDVEETPCKSEAAALVHIWMANVFLAVQRTQCMLYARMLQYLSTSRRCALSVTAGGGRQRGGGAVLFCLRSSPVGPPPRPLAGLTTAIAAQKANLYNLLGNLSRRHAHLRRPTARHEVLASFRHTRSSEATVEFDPWRNPT